MAPRDLGTSRNAAHGGANGGAGKFVRYTEPVRWLALLAALGTGLIALWLFMVATFVLPARDPAHVGMWTRIALAFLLYAGVTVAFAARDARPGWLQWLVVAGSLAALAFGGHEIWSMAFGADASAHFEGYVLVMGAVIAGHGACALGYVALAAWGSRRVAAA